MKFTFVTSIALVLYTYILYPLLLLAFGGAKQLASDFRFSLRRGNRRSRLRATSRPTVSLIFAAHNEETVIGQKLRNAVTLDYPIDRLEILVGCDGCTDMTAPLARAMAPSFVTVHEFTDRSGKPAVLNRLVPLARGDIVIFCDANTQFDVDTIKLLVRHFDDPQVGCVCGELRLRTAAGRPHGETLYWRYETALKFLESRFNMLVGGNGAVMAIRRPLFVAVPPHGIVEDFLIAMQVRAAGYRVVYDPEAVAWEEVSAKIRHEFNRRVRIGAGNFHALRYTWRLLSPVAGSIAVSFWSHKICRWLVPIALCAAQIAAVALAGRLGYLASAAALAMMPLIGFVGYQLDARQRYWAPVSIPYYFLSMNLALLVGFFSFVSGRQSLVWNPTVREAPNRVDDEVRHAADDIQRTGAGV